MDEGFCKVEPDPIFHFIKNELTRVNMMEVKTMRHSLKSESITRVMTKTATTAMPMLRNISLRMAKELSQFLYTFGVIFGMVSNKIDNRSF